MTAHVINFPPYTLTFEGVQWTVKKTVPKPDATGNREVLVGYYAFLDAALKFGVIQDDANQSATANAIQLVARMEAVWEDIKQEAKTWASLPNITRIDRATGATETDGEAESPAGTESGTESDATSATSSGRSGAALPENKPARQRLMKAATTKSQ